ncbi:hypothetical protein HDV00_002758 [Rhizophlyctis rosea]|nr:hypothetical protein HDV00_002758 [Rhizophlyctis rosea]
MTVEKENVTPEAKAQILDIKNDVQTAELPKTVGAFGPGNSADDNDGTFPVADRQALFKTQHILSAVDLDNPTEKGTYFMELFNGTQGYARKQDTAPFELKEDPKWTQDVEPFEPKTAKMAHIISNSYAKASQSSFSFSLSGSTGSIGGAFGFKSESVKQAAGSTTITSSRSTVSLERVRFHFTLKQLKVSQQFHDRMLKALEMGLEAERESFKKDSTYRDAFRGRATETYVKELMSIQKDFGHVFPMDIGAGGLCVGYGESLHTVSSEDKAKSSGLGAGVDAGGKKVLGAFMSSRASFKFVINFTHPHIDHKKGPSGSASLSYTNGNSEHKFAKWSGAKDGLSYYGCSEDEDTGNIELHPKPKDWEVIDAVDYRDIMEMWNYLEDAELTKLTALPAEDRIYKMKDWLRPFWRHQDSLKSIPFPDDIEPTDKRRERPSLGSIVHQLRYLKLAGNQIPLFGASIAFLTSHYAMFSNHREFDPSTFTGKIRTIEQMIEATPQRSMLVRIWTGPSVEGYEQYGDMYLRRQPQEGYTYSKVTRERFEVDACKDYIWRIKDNDDDHYSIIHAASGDHLWVQDSGSNWYLSGSQPGLENRKSDNMKFKFDRVADIRKTELAGLLPADRIAFRIRAKPWTTYYVLYNEMMGTDWIWLNSKSDELKDAGTGADWIVQPLKAELGYSSL